MYKSVKKVNISKSWINFIAVCFALLTSIAFSAKPQFVKIEDIAQSFGTENIIMLFITKMNTILDGHQLLWFILIVFLFIFYRKYVNKIVFIEKSLFIPASLFALFMLFGASFNSLGTWELIFGDFLQIIISLICFIGYFIFFYAVIDYIFAYLEKEDISTISQSSGKICTYIFELHPMWMCGLIVFFAWLPIIILFYPGSVTYDSMAQLQMFFGERTMSNHWPIFSTLVIGFCLKIGRFILSDNLGIFIYVLFQAIFLAISFGGFFSMMRQWNTPLLVRKISLLFFAILPFFPGIAQSVVKDVLYLDFFVVYCLLIVYYVINKNTFLNKPLVCKISLAIVAIMMCLFRKDGLYVVLLSGLAVLCLEKSKRAKIKWSVGLVILFIVLHIWNNVFIPWLGIYKGSSREMLSIPLQQTARYIKYHDSEVSLEERKIIDKVLAYDLMSEKYNPELSDPVKNTYKNPSKEELIKYFHVWLKQFVKHPGTYIQATLHNTYRYFCPDANIYMDGLGLATSIAGNAEFQTGFIQISMVEDWHPWRQTIYNYMLCIQKLPGIGIFVGLGIYTWMSILMISYLFRKKLYRCMVVFVPTIVVFLICIASPVNGALRYYMPVIFVMPLLIAYFIYVIKQPVKDFAEDTN